MKKVKAIWSSIKAFINKHFNKGVETVFEFLKENATIAVKITQALKTFSDGPLDEIISQVVPATAPVFDILRREIPAIALKVAIGQKLVDASTDPDNFLVNLATLLEGVSEQEKEDFLVRFSAELTRRISDKDFSYSDFVYCTQLIFTQLYKSQA